MKKKNNKKVMSFTAIAIYKTNDHKLTAIMSNMHAHTLTLNATKMVLWE